MKESVIKAIGVGLGYKLNSFSVMGFILGKKISLEKDWYNKVIKYKDYYISVTSEEKIDDVEIIEIDN